MHKYCLETLGEKCGAEEGPRICSDLSHFLLVMGKPQESTGNKLWSFREQRMFVSLSSRRTDLSMFTLLNKKSTNNLVLTVYAAKVIAVDYTSSACTLRTRIIFGRFLDWITPKGQRAQGWAMFGSLQLTQQSLHIQMLHLFFCYSTKHTTSTIIPYYKNCNIEFAVQIIWPEVYTA